MILSNWNIPHNGHCNSRLFFSKNLLFSKIFMISGTIVLRHKIGRCTGGVMLDSLELKDHISYYYLLIFFS